MTRTPFLFALALGIAMTVSTGCSEEASKPEIEPATYTVRGQIARMPAEDGGQLKLHHEEIPQFVGYDGKVIGMGSMKMDFPLAKDVDLTGYNDGDKVAVTFVVTWDPARPYEITSITGLPADTTLDFEATPATQPAHDDHAGHNH